MINSLSAFVVWIIKIFRTTSPKMWLFEFSDEVTCLLHPPQFHWLRFYVNYFTSYDGISILNKRQHWKRLIACSWISTKHTSMHSPTFNLWSWCTTQNCINMQFIYSSTHIRSNSFSISHDSCTKLHSKRKVIISSASHFAPM